MELNDLEFAQWQEYIHILCGVKIGEDKKYLISNRLGPIARKMGCNSFSQFYFMVKQGNSPVVIDQVVDAVTTHETSFFRDFHPFSFLKEYVFQQLIVKLNERQLMFGGKGARVHIWCVAASSGQEPYSVAMCLDEYLNGLYSPPCTKKNFQILATDISASILNKARVGEYDKLEIKRGISPLRKQKYFQRQEDMWVLNKEIREMVEFKELNLCKPFSLLLKYDVIICRNVLIYFNDKNRIGLLAKFHQLLDDDGVLLLGSSENVCDLPDSFESQRYNSTLFYRKKRVRNEELRVKSAECRVKGEE